MWTIHKFEDCKLEKHKDYTKEDAEEEWLQNKEAIAAIE